MRSSYPGHAKLPEPCCVRMPRPEAHEGRNSRADLALSVNDHFAVCACQGQRRMTDTAAMPTLFSVSMTRRF